MKLKTFAWTISLTTIAGIAAIGLWCGYLQLVGNFHEVIPGRYYRSAQLSSTALGKYIDEYGIRTVINLRGEHPTHEWYRDEAAAVAAHGAALVNFHMSAKRQLTIDQSVELVNLMRNAKGPILVHCQAGADRTGLASVMYLQQIAGVGEETAEWQLTPLYGHINLPFLETYAMDDTWEAFEKYIGLPS